MKRFKARMRETLCNTVFHGVLATILIVITFTTMPPPHFPFVLTPHFIPSSSVNPQAATSLLSRTMEMEWNSPDSLDASRYFTL
mmetsp:Transcript_17980/g.37292  ORF Transcript_17980/g.37292 Transcript_17980/m.37292 type:complete len:84 (-) Transcript_17980:265-516(-)